MFAGHDRSTKIDRIHVIEGRFGQFKQRRVSSCNTHSDIVMQYVDASPPLLCEVDRFGEGGFVSDVRFERDALCAFPRRKLGSVRGGTIDPRVKMISVRLGVGWLQHHELRLLNDLFRFALLLGVAKKRLPKMSIDKDPLNLDRWVS